MSKTSPKSATRPALSPEFVDRLIDVDPYEEFSVNMSTPEPAPVNRDDRPAVWDLVIQDMHDRDAFGEAKHGTRLRPDNARKSLRDAYQEVLDLAVYLRQRIWEDENSSPGLQKGLDT